MNSKEREIFTSAPPSKTLLDSGIRKGWELGILSGSLFFEQLPLSEQIASVPDDMRCSLLLKCGAVGSADIARTIPPEVVVRMLEVAVTDDMSGLRTDPQNILPAQWICHLDAIMAWTYLAQPLSRASQTEANPRDKQLLRELFEIAIKQELMTPIEMISSISVDTLVEHVPPQCFAAVCIPILKLMMQGQSVDEQRERLIGNGLQPELLVEHVPFAELWHKTAVPLIAERHKLIAPTTTPSVPDEDEPLAPKSTRRGVGGTSLLEASDVTQASDPPK